MKVRPRLNKLELALIIDGLMNLSLYSCNGFIKKEKNILMNKMINFYNRKKVLNDE